MTQIKDGNEKGTNAVLEVENYSVDFWVEGVWYPAAIDMNFKVQAGKVLAIVGESGSGKSTTAMGLMDLLASNARVSGSVKVHGEEMIGAKKSLLRKIRGRDVAYIFQEPMTALNLSTQSVFRLLKLYAITLRWVQTRLKLVP